MHLEVCIWMTYVCKLYERFLAKFKRDPPHMPIPFMDPGQSPFPVALGGPVCSAIAMRKVSFYEKGENCIIMIVW